MCISDVTLLFIMVMGLIIMCMCATAMSMHNRFWVGMSLRHTLAAEVQRLNLDGDKLRKRRVNRRKTRLSKV